MFITQHWLLWLIGTLVSVALAITLLIMAINAMNNHDEGVLPKLGLFLFFIVSSLVFGSLLGFAGMADMIKYIVHH